VKPLRVLALIVLAPICVPFWLMLMGVGIMTGQPMVWASMMMNWKYRPRRQMGHKEGNMMSDPTGTSLKEAVAKWERQQSEQEAALLAAERKQVDEQQTRQAELDRNAAVYMAKIGTVVAPVVAEVRQELSGKIHVNHDQRAGEHGATIQIFTLRPLIGGTVKQVPLEVALGDDGMVTIGTDARMGMVRVTSPEDIVHCIRLDDLDQPRFRQILHGYVRAMIAPTSRGLFSDT
jgi:hypothetical protein